MNILKEAEAIIYGEREQTYGNPAKNLDAIARLWTVYIDEKKTPLTAEDVASMMVLLKIARLINSPRHRDSLVDICGYTALIERIANHEQGE